MTGAVTLSTRDGVAFVTIQAPPVNALSLAVRRGLVDAMARVAADDSIAGAVLHGDGRCFSAGGDIREMDTPDAAARPRLSADVHPAIETCGKTVVAALHGHVLGGGLETALACHRRVATPDARLGLPEVTLGLIPLSGTQRLPRLVDLSSALALIVTGAPVTAADAPAGLVDRVVDAHDLLAVAADLARQPAPPLARDRPATRNDDPAVIAGWRTRIAAGPHAASAHRCLDAVLAGLGADSLDAGMAAARLLYDQALHTTESAIVRRHFIARHATQEFGT